MVGIMWKMAGETVTHSNRPMDIASMDEVRMADETQFLFWDNQSIILILVTGVAIITFFFVIREVR